VGKFTAGVVDTLANLRAVSLIPVEHLDLQIFCKFWKKFEMTLLLFSGAWRKKIHEKI
jgi:hypothetical protein